MSIYDIRCFSFCFLPYDEALEPYYKSKLELKSNSSENRQLIASLSVILLKFKLTKLKLGVLKSDF